MRRSLGIMSGAFALKNQGFADENGGPNAKNHHLPGF
jgi:hypothetical protein